MGETIKALLKAYLRPIATQAAQNAANAREPEIRAAITDAATGTLKPHVLIALGLGATALFMGVNAYLKARRVS